ncbi:MAG: hypothetical protein ACQGVC_02275 [Myxococcota bacterium]
MRGVAIAFVACLAIGCGADAAGERAQRSGRAIVDVRPDGGFTTLLRGESPDHFDGPRDVAATPDGGVVVVGGTESPDFPTTPGVHQRRFASGGTKLGSFPEMDVFVTRLHRDGRVAWSTLLGGPNYDRAYAVEVDARGFVVVAGRAGDGFPTTDGALQPGFAGDDAPNRAYGPQDGFVARFDPRGRLVWSTYLGGPSFGFVRDIDLDTDGNVYAALRGSGPFPYVTPGAFQTQPGGGSDDVLVKLDAGGGRVHWATHIAREGDEGEPTVRVDARGRVYVLTSTTSDGWFPSGEGYQTQRAGDADLLLLRFSSDGAYEAGTYLGGSRMDATETHHLAIDPQGRAVLAVFTTSPDMPIPTGAKPYRSEHGPSSHDGYVAVLSPDLDALEAATYLGNAGSSGGFEGIGIDADGNVWAGGATGGGLAPSPDALQAAFGGKRDAFVARFAPRLDRATYLSYWGGPLHEGARTLTLDFGGRPVAAGQAAGDVFVLRFVPSR